MARLKESKTYYFSVEGETEKWYLDWLVSIINSTKYSTHKVSIKSEVQKRPCKICKEAKCPW